MDEISQALQGATEAAELPPMTLLEAGQSAAKRKFNGRAGTFAWTAARIEQLKLLHAEGLSCSRIAYEMGGDLSRNAVIGKVHRLGLIRERHLSPLARPKPAPDYGGGTIQRIRNKKGTAARNGMRPGGADGGVLFRLRERPELKLPQTREHPEEPVSRDLTLLELTDAVCRWPHGDGPFLFCGHDVEEFGRPYCAFHSRLGVGRQPPQYSAAELERKRRRAMAHLAALHAERGRRR